MNGFLKKIWHDPVWSKVISVGILGALGLAVKVFTPDQYLNLLFIEVPIKIWIIILLSTLVFILAAYSITLKNKVQKHTKKDVPTIEGKHLEVYWRGKHNNEKVWDIKAYCTNCDYELDDIYDGKEGEFFYVFCTKCEQDLPHTVNVKWGKDFARKEMERELRALTKK